MDPESEEYAQLSEELEIMRGQLKAIEDTGVITQYNELYKNLMAVDAAQSQLDSSRTEARPHSPRQRPNFSLQKTPSTALLHRLPQ